MAESEFSRLRNWYSPWMWPDRLILAKTFSPMWSSKWMPNALRQVDWPLVVSLGQLAILIQNKPWGTWSVRNYLQAFAAPSEGCMGCTKCHRPPEDYETKRPSLYLSGEIIWLKVRGKARNQSFTLVYAAKVPAHGFLWITDDADVETERANKRGELCIIFPFIIHSLAFHL